MTRLLKKVLSLIGKSEKEDKLAKLFKDAYLRSQKI